VPVAQNPTPACVLPDPPPAGSTVEEVLAWLTSISMTPVPSATFDLFGYVFTVARPTPPTPPPTVWYVTVVNPATATNTARIASRLGWQWSWAYAIQTIQTEIIRLANLGHI
jgi:hypothetical protein